MRQLTLLAIPDCPLSAHARRVLDTLATDGLLVWGDAATGTPNGEALQPNAPDLLPALFNEFGHLLAHGDGQRRLGPALIGSRAHLDERGQPVPDPGARRSGTRPSA